MSLYCTIFLLLRLSFNVSIGLHAKPPAASKRSSTGINARTKLAISSLVRYRKALFVKVVHEGTTFDKLGGRNGQIMYRHHFGPVKKTMLRRGDIIILLLSDLKIMGKRLIWFYLLSDFTVVLFCSFACHRM